MEAVKHTPVVGGVLFNLSWSEVMRQFENLVKFASKSVLESLRGQGIVTDGMISSEDLYQEGITCLWVCWSKYGIKDMEEFGRLFKKSLFRILKRRAVASHIMVDLDEVLSDACYTPSVIENLYIKEGIKQLQDCLTAPISKSILQELISPSQRTVWEVWADKERKKTLKIQGKKVNVPNTSEIKIKHIRAALGITPKQMDLALLEMRQAASNIFSDSDELTSEAE